MRANCYWKCQGCGLTNLSQMDTVGPHLDLVCSECKQAQHVRLTLQDYVHDRIGPPVPAKEEATR